MFRNKIINGNMRIDQRNAGSAVTINSSSATYSVDRWLGFGMASAGVFTLNQSTTAPDNFNYSLAATCTTADATISAGDRYFIDQRIEGTNIEDYGFGTSAAKTYCLSFWVQSSLTGTYCVAFINSDGTRSYVAEYTINQADTWEYKTIVILGDTSGTWLTDKGIGITIRFALATGTTYQTTANTWTAGNFNATANQVNWLSSNSSRFFRITGVQLEEGSAETPFELRPFGIENQLCMRYYQYFGSSAATGALAVGYMGTSTSCRFQIPLVVPLRDVPSVIISGTDPFIRYTNSSFNGLAAAYNITSWPTAAIGGGAACGTSVGFIFTVPTGFAGSVAIVAGATLAWFDAEL
jgi:hypothetical protein